MEKKLCMFLCFSFYIFCATVINALQRINHPLLESKSLYLPSPIVPSRSRMLSKKHYLIHDNFVPHLFDEVPVTICSVTYCGPGQYHSGDPNNIDAYVGRLVNNSDTTFPPILVWFDEDDCYYTMMMIDFDSPNRKSPIYRPWLHWLVMNIEMYKLDEGDVIAEYVGTWPEKDSGYHRYVIIVYKQPYKFNETIEFIPRDDVISRRNFNNTEFAAKWNLSEKEEDMASSFFVTEYSDFVDTTYKDLILKSSNLKGNYKN